MNQKFFLCFNGKGSSGKDTQADILKEYLGDSTIKISTGDIYRDARDGTGEYGKYHDLIQPYIDEVDKMGGYVSDEVIFAITKVVILDKLKEGYENIIFTGFPRTEGQLKLLDELVTTLDGFSCLHVHFDVSDETTRDRARSRREYALSNNLPVREDDKEEVVERRLAKFKEATLPMLRKLDIEDRLYTIKAEGTIPEVQKETTLRLTKETWML